MIFLSRLPRHLPRAFAPAAILTLALGACFEDVPKATSGGGASASDGTGGSESGGGSSTAGESSTGGATGTTGSTGAATGGATGGGMGGMGDPCSPIEANCAQGLKCAPLLAMESDKGFLPDLEAGRCVMAPANPAQPFSACVVPMKGKVEGADVLLENCVPGSVCLHGLEKTPDGMMYSGACRPLCSFGQGAEPPVPCPETPLNGPLEGAVSPPPVGTDALCVGLGASPQVGMCMAWCNPLRETLQGAKRCVGIAPLDSCFELGGPGDGVAALVCLPWETPGIVGSPCVSGTECGAGSLCIDGSCRLICEQGNQTACSALETCAPIPFSAGFPDPPGPLGWLDKLGYCVEL